HLPMTELRQPGRTLAPLGLEPPAGQGIRFVGVYLLVRLQVQRIPLDTCRPDICRSRIDANQFRYPGSGQLRLSDLADMRLPVAEQEGLRAPLEQGVRRRRGSREDRATDRGPRKGLTVAFRVPKVGVGVAVRELVRRRLPGEVRGKMPHTVESENDLR